MYNFNTMGSKWGCYKVTKSLTMRFSQDIESKREVLNQEVKHGICKRVFLYCSNHFPPREYMSEYLINEAREMIYRKPSLGLFTCTSLVHA